MTVDTRVHDMYIGGMVNERRPRIPAELAEKLDELREEHDVTFERYITEVLERHVDRMAERQELEDIAFQASRKSMHGFTDPAGVNGYLDRLPLGGWGEGRKYPGVMAGFVIADDESGFEPLGIYLTEQELRAMRDAITEILGELA